MTKLRLPDLTRDSDLTTVAREMADALERDHPRRLAADLLRRQADRIERLEGRCESLARIMSFGLTRTPEWLYVMSGPCEYCATWIGAHRHSVRPNGVIGNVVEQVLTSPLQLEAADPQSPSTDLRLE